LSDDETAAAILAGRETPALTEREGALADWARNVVVAPGETTDADIARLRNLGLDDQTIFEATAFIALRLAFSTINGALGAAPDHQLANAAPRAIRAAVNYGRPPSAEPSRP
jgi:alkylhydroperoxidase family enzyme